MRMRREEINLKEEWDDNIKMDKDWSV
jgi:hypothetical protein